MHISSIARAALVACVLVLSATAPAGAAPVAAELRVEAGGFDLDPGFRYLSDTATITTDQTAACGGKGKSFTFEGPTGLGIVQHASSYNQRLAPLRVSDKFDFGLLVCGIGSFVQSTESFWLFKVNHVSPEIGADKYPLEAGDEVLWFFQNLATGSNVGNELELIAPRAAAPGSPVEVEVVQYDFAGKRTPAAGVRILGASEEALTDEAGKATISFAASGQPVLRAVKFGDVPSQSLRVCVGAVTACDAMPLSRLVGTDVGDKLAGGAGAELIVARGGPDTISVSGGGVDTVRCGSGRDNVTADKADRVSRDCERVSRR